MSIFNSVEKAKTMKMTVVIIAVTALNATAISAQEMRTWRVNNQDVEAVLSGGGGDSIRLKKSGERTSTTVLLSDLSEQDRKYAVAELAKRAEKRVWDSELRKVGDVVSMAYKTGSKFNGLSIHGPKYASKVEKLSKTTFKNPKLGVIAQTMCGLIAEKVRWARVASGWQDPEPLTQAEIDDRIQSANDALNAGLGDEEAMGNLVDHMASAFRKLQLNRTRAADNQRILTKGYIRAWRDFVGAIEPNCGPETDKPIADLKFEYSVTKTGAIGRVAVPDSKLFVRNRSGQSLRHVILKVASSASSGVGGTKTFYFYFPSWGSGRAIELPPESYDSIFSGLFIGSDQLLPPSEAVRFADGESVVTLSIWSEQLTRQSVDFGFSGEPKVNTKKTRLRSAFGGPSVVNQQSTVEMALSEVK